MQQSVMALWLRGFLGVPLCNNSMPHIDLSCILNKWRQIMNPHMPHSHMDDTAKFSYLLGVHMALYNHIHGSFCLLKHLLSRNKKPLILSSFTSWTLIRLWGLTLRASLSVPPVQSRKSLFNDIKLLNNHILFQHNLWLLIKLSSILFLSKLYILYFFLPHSLFIIVDLRKSCQ